MTADEKSLKESLLGASPFLMKILEVLLTVLCIGFIIFSPYNSHKQTIVSKAAFVYSVYTSAILLTVLIIVSHFIKEQVPKKTCLIIAGYCGVSMLIAGTMLINDWKNIQYSPYTRSSKHNMDLMVTSGIFSVLASASFITDIVLTIRYG